MRFCNNCENILKFVIKNNDMKFECTKCNKLHDPNDEDSLRFYQSFGKIKDNSIFIKNSAHDPVNAMIKKDCSKCKRKIMSYIIEGSKMAFRYTCKCGNIE